MKTGSALSQQKQEEYFRSNIHNMTILAEKRYEACFSSFLDERQQQIAEEVLRHSHCSNYLFFGGTAGCERRMLGVFPEGIEPDEAEFPIQTLKLTVKGETSLTHRDYLGSLMGLQLKREAIGDILMLADGAAVFIERDLSVFLSSNLERIGRSAVTVGELPPGSVEKKQEFRLIQGSVSSLRLDCIVALMLNKSRTVAAELIHGGLVRRNYVEETNVSRICEGGDVLSVRGKGKFILEEEFKRTKKDRIFITVRQLL